MRTMMMGAALALTTATAQAQTAPAAVAAPAAIDPAALAMAGPLADKLFPPGTYSRLMGSTMNSMMDSMMDSMMQMPIGQFARMAGVPEQDLAKLDKASMAQLMEILDPAFKERSSLSMRAMMGGMTSLMTDFEPRVRVALARAYARKFTPAQLKELDAFFNTPTGGVFAAESFAIYGNPEMLGAMQALMPELMQKMPELMGAVQKATAHLPPPRKPKDLTPADKARLEALLGPMRTTVPGKEKPAN